MKILGIDTSNLVLSVALIEDEKTLGEMTTNLKKNHSVRLMPAIDDLMDALSILPDELDGIAVAEGPGSYTGVRIGVATAKSMAWALGIPLIGVSSLEAIAWNTPFFQGMISPLFDARRGRVYTGLYRSGDGELHVEQEDRIIPLNQWLDQLKAGGEPVLFLGDDVRLHFEQIEAQLGELAHFTTPEYHIPRASHIARQGLKKISQMNPEALHRFAPAYLQLAEAEAKWLEKQKN
ncbi:MAG: tRNA (adenosine(37)-N6)-threonylcarbamoyltransferase complex dimerization subunit type 1 TsaB [Bacillaceae bacterium]|nr:tRNA (adenosine(37)-N6)-threonylcarbamoyltransferase complex dimerization subunit type 1 TsaB [Bacillaceae bacterium]